LEADLDYQVYVPVQEQEGSKKGKRGKATSMKNKIKSDTSDSPL
jgi:hypothetical protein